MANQSRAWWCSRSLIQAEALLLYCSIALLLYCSNTLMLDPISK
ncbi:hypothetical protein VCR6J2_410070 [Vibrio coralliirubri]|nr:hypothetical protein VCR1J2_200249 [Vibrio coralliirubri]CDT40359.1 hypothetical protein VCR6J2_410070 [Vibrio coralliirubri]